MADQEVAQLRCVRCFALFEIPSPELPTSADDLLGWCERCSTNFLANPLEPQWMRAWLHGRHFEVMDGPILHGARSVILEIEHGGARRALKICLPRPIARRRAHELVVREGEIHRQLDHPNIVKMYSMNDVGAGGLIAIEMDYLDGHNLVGEYLVRHPRGLPVDRALMITQQALAALAYAHDVGVVHRDIKPANFVLTSSEQRPLHVHLVDFGLAKLFEFGGHTSLTRDGSIHGTEGYIPPEFLTQTGWYNYRRATPLADLFGVGATLYQLLTAHVPHVQTPSGHSIVPIADLRPDVPARLARVVMKALSYRPEDRFGSAAEMAGALREIRDVA